MSKLNAIESIMDGYNPHRQLLEQTRQLIGKWEPTGLLEGIEDEQRLHGMAVLLENQARQLIDESARTGTSSNSEEWSGVALPLVRRIFGELAAQDFVSVQPMNLPSGLIFYLDFKYGTTQTGQHAKGSHIHGNTSASNADASGGLYGAGKFGYSINDQTANVVIGSVTQASASWKEVEFEPSLSSSIATTATDQIVKITIEKASIDAAADWEGIRSFAVSGSDISAHYPAYSYTTGPLATDEAVFFVKSTNGVLATEDVNIKYHKQPADTSRGDLNKVHLLYLHRVQQMMLIFLKSILHYGQLASLLRLVNLKQYGLLS